MQLSLFHFLKPYFFTLGHILSFFYSNFTLHQYSVLPFNIITILLRIADFNLFYYPIASHPPIAVNQMLKCFNFIFKLLFKWVFLVPKPICRSLKKFNLTFIYLQFTSFINTSNSVDKILSSVSYSI